MRSRHTRGLRERTPHSVLPHRHRRCKQEVHGKPGGRGRGGGRGEDSGGFRCQWLLKIYVVTAQSVRYLLPAWYGLVLHRGNSPRAGVERVHATPSISLRVKSKHTHTAPLLYPLHTRFLSICSLSFLPRDCTRDATGRDPADARSARATLRARTPRRGTDPGLCLATPRHTDRDSPARGPSRARASSISACDDRKRE